MFCYHKARADPNEGVTKDTYRIWRGRNPNDRSDLTDNAWMNQRRYIERQNKLTNIEIENIKRRIESEVNIQNSQAESAVADVLVKKTNSSHEKRNQDHVEPSQGEEIEDLVKEIKKVRTEWENVSMSERPSLPKIAISRKTKLLIKQANQAIQLVIVEETPSLNHINLLQYVTAYVISEKIGKTPKKTKRRTNKGHQPKWKTRIENQIKGMRADLSILSEIVQKGETENISKKKSRINYRITINQELQTITEFLKMKIQAKAQRIRRYVKRSKQCRQNQMFSNNRKTFFRNLGKDQILVEKPPNKEATETFWRNILESDREHNHSDEWIRREEQKYADTEFQSWVDISQEELQTPLKKASNWTSAGLDAVLNFWLKQLTALHPHLLNAYNQAIEHPENLPAWFTTAQTAYFLAKNKDTENPKNYRPIACLSTSYKVLTSILTERSYSHVMKNSILPEKQRGSARNSYGSKDQLLINKTIIEDCKRRKRT